MFFESVYLGTYISILTIMMNISVTVKAMDIIYYDCACHHQGNHAHNVT